MLTKPWHTNDPDNCAQVSPIQPDDCIREPPPDTLPAEAHHHWNVLLDRLAEVQQPGSSKLRRVRKTDAVHAAEAAMKEHESRLPLGYPKPQNNPSSKKAREASLRASSVIPGTVDSTERIPTKRSHTNETGTPLTEPPRKRVKGPPVFPTLDNPSVATFA